MIRRKARLPLVAVAALGLAGGLGYSFGDSSDTPVLAAEASVPIVQTSVAVSDTATSVAPLMGGVFERIPDVVERVQPSVVSVLVETDQGFAEGSGVVWDGPLGQIVTNNHVVQDAVDVDVILVSGERLDAEVLATDPLTDLAVITVGRTDLPSASFANELPRVGELAITLGNPLGFENSVTAGIVSGLHRAIPAGGLSLVDLVQTDAPISPGNSGGALVDATGEVVGINVAAIPPTADTRAASLGFAIPATTVRGVVDDLITQGFAEHAFLGIQPANLVPDLIEEFELTAAEGVVVAGLVDGGAAEAAGLMTGDVIVEFDGRPIRIVADIFTSLRGYEPGDSVTLGVDRAGERMDVEVTLGGEGGR